MKWRDFGFDPRHIKGDFFGGLTSGIVALPLALAFGVSSGLGPDAGLYGAIFISFFAALFGGTATQISGPTAPMTAVSMVVVAGIVASFEGDVDRALPTILLVFLLAGLMQVALGAMGIGMYIKYIPYPVVSGFMSAIGIIIVVTQILPAVGYYPKEDWSYVEQFKPLAEERILENILREEADEGILVLEDFSETIKRGEQITEEDIATESKILAGSESSGVIGSIKVIPRALKNIRWLELWLTLGTILIIYGFRWITRAVPSTLVALIVVSGLAAGLQLDYRTIETIPSGFPILQLNMFNALEWGALSPYVFTALSLALLGAIDSLLTSVVADNMTQTRHKPNQELVGQGIGNSIAALFGGIPGAGATIRTVVNINSGGRTKLSGMIAGVLLLVIMIGFAPIASLIPAAVLAGILITVGIAVMDYKGLKALPYMPRSEAVILVLVMLLSAAWNLVYAVGIGLIIASLMFMKQIGDLTAKRSLVRTLKDDEVWADEKEFPNELRKEVAIKHIKGPLFFGSTTEFQQLASTISPSAEIVIIRLDRMQYIDVTGLNAMEELLVRLAQQNRLIILVGLLPQPRLIMERYQVIPKLVAESHVFEKFSDSVKWIEEYLHSTHG